MSGPSGVRAPPWPPPASGRGRARTAATAAGTSRTRPTSGRAPTPAPPPRRRAPGRGRVAAVGSHTSTRASASSRSGRSALVGREPGQPRLHPVEVLPLGEAFPLLGAPPGPVRSSAAARSRTSGVASSSRAGNTSTDSRSSGGALVGDRERGEPVDVVAPQVDAHRMVVGDRVHVDDRAAHRDLAARLDLVLAPVAERDEPLDQLVAVDASRPARTTTGSVSSTWGPSRCTRARTGATTTRSAGRRRAQPPQDPQAPTHRLERRRHPLERQRLPRREPLDVLRVEEAAQVVRQPLRLGAGRHRDDDRPPRT